MSLKLRQFWLWIDARCARAKINKVVADILLKSRKRGLTYCLPPDELILCNPEIKSISMIDYGDKVLTQSGTFEKVIQLHRRWYDGEMIRITPSKLGIPFELTPNHKVFVDKNIGIPAGSLVEGQEIMYPIVDGVKDIENIKLSECFTEKITPKRGITKSIISDIVNKKIDVSKRGWWKGRYNISSKLAYYIKSRITKGNKTYGWKLTDGKWFLPCDKKYVPDSIIVSEDFMKLAGIYVADGSADIGKRKGGISIAFNLKKEKDKAIKYSKIIENIFGIRPIIEEYPKVSLLRLRLSIFPIAVMFKEMFGHGALNKKVPMWFLTLSIDKQKAFIEGYIDGDGHITKKGENVIVTVSPTLHYQVLQMLLRCGVIPSTLKLDNAKSKNKIFRTYWNRTSRLGRIADGSLFIPIRKIERYQYKGLVYNIGVENDHSYSLMSASCFNCFTAQLLDLLDKRVRKVMDFTAYPLLNPLETICKVSIFRSGFPNQANYLKTFYFKTGLVFTLYDHREEIQLIKENDEDAIIVFQESPESKPKFFDTWEQADKFGEEFWQKIYKTTKGLI
jgi:intein/homing endonuclease